MAAGEVDQNWGQTLKEEDREEGEELQAGHPGAVEAEQTPAHGLAWLAPYVEALRQMQGWARRLEAEGRFGETEALIGAQPVA